MALTSLTYIFFWSVDVKWNRSSPDGRVILPRVLLRQLRLEKIWSSIWHIVCFVLDLMYDFTSYLWTKVDMHQVVQTEGYVEEHKMKSRAAQFNGQDILELWPDSEVHDVGCDFSSISSMPLRPLFSMTSFTIFSKYQMRATLKVHFFILLHPFVPYCTFCLASDAFPTGTGANIAFMAGFGSSWASSMWWIGYSGFGSYYCFWIWCNKSCISPSQSSFFHWNHSNTAGSLLEKCTKLKFELVKFLWIMEWEVVDLFLV